MTETVDACIIAALETKLQQADNRLAKAHTLIDALNRIAAEGNYAASVIAIDALIDYEQEAA